jgi:hypothetical protein
MLDEELSISQQELKESAQKLIEYEIGFGFDKLVEEFAVVLEKIESTKWNLEELEKARINSEG